jgi:glycosyltransferase involved in cell wall biosynthesis
MLTVLMATRNRARILRDVLDSYCHLEPPSSDWKLVIVDNGSTDQTAQVLASFANRLPLRSVCEPRLGKNNALNTGLALVEGDLTILTDDDVFPSADWLVQLRKAADARPVYSIFGGPVAPRWEVNPPPWIQWVPRDPTFGVNDRSLKEGPVPPSWLHNIIGPNMAIRSSIFQSGIRFESSIGPCGSNYPMGSERELLLRLSEQGHAVWYVQGAVVEHLIREQQLDKTWILQRAIRFGRGIHRLSRNPKLWLGFPRHLFRDIPKEVFRMALASVFFRPEALFRAHWRLNFLRGEAIEAGLLARERHARMRPNSSNRSLNGGS